jgi:S-adenosylmethionine synthetase
MVDTFGTNKVDEEKIEAAVKANFRMKPAELIADLDLLKPIYKNTAAYGHFGRNCAAFKWEHTDKVDVLRDAVGL